MTNDGKENIRHVTCTNHTTRSDRDLFRVCPSKLSKRELEDLYFSLLENNKQLKKTVNGQRDHIKLLNTKVNRMTVQKNALGNLNKDCCSGVKAIINEQKESIADLKNANERLTDRIRLLNMRLCSAKQFLRRSPAQSSTRCPKCCLTPNPSVKNSSMSALNAKRSDANLRSQTEAGSCQFLNKENSILKADENVEASLTEMKDEPCQQNKCRTVMDELKQKIENLEEELSKTHEQYSERMRKLEEQMRDLRVENTRVRALQAESDHRLEAEEKRAGELLRKLRDAETQCDNLETELQIEKSKVCELETQVKAADLSSQLAAALERHLKNNMTNRRASVVQSRTELRRVPTLDLCASDWSYSPPMLVPNNSETSKYSGPENENNVIKNSDDSGYAEKFDDKKGCPKSDQNILDQIASLQAQLNSLKLSMGSQNHNDPGDDMKSVTGDSLQKNESETNETYAVMGTRSSLSEDIFRPSRLKNQIDQCPSTSKAPDFLISMEDINRSPPKGSVKSLNKFDSHSKFQMPLPVDAPRMPYFGETGNSHQSLNRLRQSGKKISSDSTFDKHFNESRDTIENVEKQSDDLRINDENRNSDHNSKEEILNGNAYDKKSRRSSLKYHHQDRSKDLSVSYDHNKIIVGSTIDIVDIDKDTQGDDNGKVIRAPCKYDSDPSVEFKVSERNLKKKIHYETQNSDTVPRNDSHFDARVSEKEFGLNIDSNKQEPSLANPNIKDKIDGINSEIQYPNDVGMTKKVASPGTSSGNPTYTIEGPPSQGKTTKDATYQVDKEIKDATIQVQNGDNHLDICQGHARICTCPHIPHRDVSVFRTCSGTLRFKTTSSTKNKFRQCHCTRDSVTDVHGNGCPRFNGAKASVNRRSAKRSQTLHPMDASNPNHQKIYKVEGSAEVTRSTSPDNTDHEISSLTDLPNEDKSPRDYISPGEEKATSTFSDSYAAATTTDYGSLSLGEIPISGAKKLSDIQMRDKQADSIAIPTTSYKIEEALNAISEELARCRELLQGQLPAQVIPGLLDYRGGY